MNKIVWMQQPGMEPFAGGQQKAFREALKAAGYQVTMQHYQPRTPWRLAGACDWLIWSFVPTQLDVWSARLFAAKQMAVVHEKVGAMFFGPNGIINGGPMNDQGFGAQFKAPWASLFFFNNARYVDAGFLG